uniref:Integrase catalytic domain-containing protein n=1 Tax=Cacopsylla melanoneura TaxID=428564 RepID=A0A8D8QQL5_9HEMI
MIRIIFDTGSQRSYVTNSLANLLIFSDECSAIEVDLTVYTFGCMKPKTIKTSFVPLKIRLSDDSVLEISAYAVPRITGPLASNFVFKQQIQKQFSDVNIAVDTKVDKPADLLIGCDLYYSFVTGQIRHVQDSLYLVQSKLGWIVCGQQIDKFPDQTLSFLTYVSGIDDPTSQFVVPDPPLNDDNIKELWELEAIGIRDSPKILQQDEIIDFFNKTTIFKDGRYHVKWPWTQYPADLPTNLGLATGRLTSLVKRLDHETLKLYDQVLQDQLRLGVIEVVEHHADFPPHPVHYLPHHCVIQEGKTTKLRVVYDASAKTRGSHSLNDYLFKGPRMLDDLVGFLILFRLYDIALVADIEKAFLQVGLQLEDRDVTRFVWLKDVYGGVHPDNIIHFRFTRVPFGIVSSPFILAATLKYHLVRQDSVEAKLISDSLYVDNLLRSVQTLEQAKAIFSVGNSTFNELSMNIREWNSNSQDFMGFIPDEKKSSKKIISVLGLEWNRIDDTLSIAVDVNRFDKPVSTKRDTLRVVASVFDPCGFIAPLTLPARILHQELWKDKCKWDDVIAQTRLEEWSKCVQILKTLKNIRLPRMFVKPSGESDPNKLSYQLHCFTDASLDAYAAVVYLRIASDDESSVSFVMSRSRLTPLRQRDHITIPKLELLGVLIGVRLVAYVKKTLNLENVQTFLWTDSQIVLAWIRSNHLLPPFVARRVAEIRSADQNQFRYVPSKLNPADAATRGDSAMYGLPALWTNGPPFLTQGNLEGDFPPESFTSASDCVSQLPSDCYITNQVLDDTNQVSGDTNQVDKATSGKTFETDLQSLQLMHFPQEMSGASTHLTKSLRLFIDKSGLLRCNAKLQNADIPYDQRFPILLPRDSPFTYNTIKKIHEEQYHVGVTHTLSLLRKKYWVPAGRSQVSKVIRKCEACIKYGGGPYKMPDMPPLPKERVNTCPPFTYTGLDYLGPLTVLHEGTSQKRWCVILTCMATRAIHLELVHDMSSEEFLLCLRRFTAARGSPVVIVSDNALQFKLSAEILNSSFSQQNNIQWRFIPELSPWQGGFYERLVGLVKHCLRRTLDRTLLSNNQLTTVVKEVECVLNTRPLTVVGTDLEHVLTPSDFLSPVSPIVLDLPGDVSSNPMTATRTALVSSWKKSQAAFSQFRTMFVDQYLSSLAERGLKPHRQPRVLSDQIPSVGDVVQVKELQLSRSYWRVGQISELVPSKDGHTRTARVRMANGHTITRSISHLYPLEISEDLQTDKEISNVSKVSEASTASVQTDKETCNQSRDSEEYSTASHSEVQTVEGNSNQVSLGDSNSRPMRKAAEIARENIRRCLTFSIMNNIVH